MYKVQRFEFSLEFLMLVASSWNVSTFLSFIMVIYYRYKIFSKLYDPTQNYWIF
jgi:hypothetical protein